MLEWHSSSGFKPKSLPPPWSAYPPWCPGLCQPWLWHGTSAHRNFVSSSLCEVTELETSLSQPLIPLSPAPTWLCEEWAHLHIPGGAVGQPHLLFCSSFWLRGRGRGLEKL